MRWLLAGLAAVALATGLVPASAAAATRYVAVDGVDSGDCTKPRPPCAHIQYAADQAVDGDTVQIARGTYVETVQVLNKGLVFVGAGAGTLADSSGATIVRAPENNETTTFELHAGELRSLRIEGGYGGAWGGIAVVYVPIGEPEVGLKVDNAVLIGGAGTADPGYGGGGLVVTSGEASGPFEVSVTDSELVGAGVLLPGSGLYLFGPLASARVEDSILLSPVGGGLGLEEGASAQMGRSTLEGVWGARLSSGLLTLSRSTVRGSVGGLEVMQGITRPAHAEVEDSLVQGGEVATSVRSFMPQEGPTTLSADGTTLIGEERAAVLVERGLKAAGAIAVLRNSIARNLSAGDAVVFDLLADGGTIEADFSNFTTAASLSGGSSIPAPGSANNVAGDPLFVDPDEGDYRLQGTSPLIDIGDPAIVAPGQLDLAGAPRSVDGDGDGVAAPDIGAFEMTWPKKPHQSSAPPQPDAPGPPPPAPDPAPIVSSLGMTNRVFAPKGGPLASASAKRSVKRGTHFTYALSEPARVTISIRRDVAADRIWVKRRVMTLTAEEQAGRQSMPFAGLARGKRLFGKYLARIVAVDAAGQSSQTHQLRFRVVRG